MRTRMKTRENERKSMETYSGSEGPSLDFQENLLDLLDVPLSCQQITA